MATAINSFMQQQLLARRERLQDALTENRHPDHLHALLDEVDRALSRMQDGSYGLCETCHDTIESDRLICDPLVRFCLDHLSRQERNALERDLELAARVQKGLLPPQRLERHGWSICYHYEPAQLVSGDYCDVVDAEDSGLYFMVGDVSGKGVAASMLMAHLHAMFRTLIPMGLSLKRVLEHASRVFAESVLPNQYATLVCGRGFADGRIEISNAGHPAPLLARDGAVRPVEGSSLPVGMFGKEEFSLVELSLRPGERLILYSDGVSEAMDASSSEYGVERLCRLVGENQSAGAMDLLGLCRCDLDTFRGQAQRHDDITLFILSRQ
ncbi:MAG: SpoIIE family protein phosphatase [Acidobacteriaceae bacterium]|nr:SpoIIE family protein phosphatase [Acidobacteriaceae bacterium]